MPAGSKPQQIFEGGQRALFHTLVGFGGLFLIVLVVPFLLGNQAAEGASEEDVREVNVVLTEFRIEPTSLAFEAGDHVRFVVENRGSIPHEFRLTTMSDADGHVAAGHEGHGEEGGEDADGVAWLLVYPKQTETLEVIFDEHSTFDMVACLLPGHYEAGMTSPLNISGVAEHSMDGTHEMDESDMSNGLDDGTHKMDDPEMGDGMGDADTDEEDHDHGTDDADEDEEDHGHGTDDADEDEEDHDH
ncbi:MAG: hypothetical protein HKN80_15395 [Acidimicrobiia bacterium]|nr:hypothetical protein [Acidimicrobiia bacterium]